MALPELQLYQSRRGVPATRKKQTCRKNQQQPSEIVMHSLECQTCPAPAQLQSKESQRHAPSPAPEPTYSRRHHLPAQTSLLCRGSEILGNTSSLYWCTFSGLWAS